MGNNKTTQRYKKNIYTAIVLVIIAGLLMIADVVIVAHSAQLKYKNNKSIKENESLQGEVDNLRIKIRSEGSIEQIEKKAINELGMVHPRSEQCVYITDKDRPSKNFAKRIRREAYGR